MVLAAPHHWFSGNGSILRFKTVFSSKAPWLSPNLGAGKAQAKHVAVAVWMLLFHPDSGPGGQVEECPSAGWSVRPDRSPTQASGFRPGRWPELLAPIRTRDPPHFSRALPYGHKTTATLGGQRGSPTKKVGRGQTRPAEGEEDEKGQRGQRRGRYFWGLPTQRGHNVLRQMCCDRVNKDTGVNAPACCHLYCSH